MTSSSLNTLKMYGSWEWSTFYKSSCLKFLMPGKFWKDSLRTLIWWSSPQDNQYPFFPHWFAPFLFLLLFYFLEQQTLKWLDTHLPNMFKYKILCNHFNSTGPKLYILFHCFPIHSVKSDICKQYGASVMIDDNVQYIQQVCILKNSRSS